MAANYAAGGKPKSFYGPMFLKGFQPILGAGGAEAAFRPQQWRKYPLVKLNEGNKREG
jgi:hypothetical protein